MSIAVAIMVVMVTLGGVLPASAQSAIRLTANPTTVQADSKFLLTWEINVTCKQISFSGGPSDIATVFPGRSRTGSIAVYVPPNAEPAGYLITGVCENYSDSVLVTVRTPPTTIRPTTTTARPPVTTTTRPPEITPNPTTTTTVPVTTPETTVTTTTPPSTTPPTVTSGPTTPGDGDLALDRDAIQPGEGLQATGTGCVPDAGVVLASGGEIVGSSVADSQGGFTTDIAFTKVEPGRHLITAKCGIVLTGQVDQLVTSSLGGQSTTLVVLVFFVLAGVALIRFA